MCNLPLYVHQHICITCITQKFSQIFDVLSNYSTRQTKIKQRQMLGKNKSFIKEKKVF